MQVRRISALSREMLTATVTATVDGVTHDPTSDVISVQIVPIGTAPTSNGFTATTWEPVTGRARVLVGPGGSPSIGVLTAGFYDIWWKITDNPEIPVISAGTFQVF